MGFMDGTRLVVGLPVGRSVGIVEGAGVGLRDGSFGKSMPGFQSRQLSN